jgi:hypothetical protein
MVLLNFVQHVFCKMEFTPESRSGMSSSRHLWNFLRYNLDPTNILVESLFVEGSRTWCLSTDLSEATDYGNISVGKQIYMSLIKAAMKKYDFPRGLALVCQSLLFDRSYILIPNGIDAPIVANLGKYKVIKRTRGWLMGDPMTKILLTIAQ